MPTELLILFIPACFALNMAPGPNNLLAMNTGRNHGVKVAMVSALGRLLAFSVMIALAASGLAVVLYTSETLFFVIKVTGACYLLWLAFCLWRAPVQNDSSSACNQSILALARQEMMLAAGNPKAILIFTAFLPQFVDPAGPIQNQFLILGGLFLLLEWLAVALYGSFGAYLRLWFSNPKRRQWFNRCCAMMLGISGGNLIISRQQ